MFVSRFCTAVIMFITLAPVMAYSGSPDSPASSTGTSSAMYTLTDIYNRLDTGTATAKRTGTFTEPTDGPGTATGRTLDEIMAKAPAKDDTNGASASHALSGKTFWGLTTAGWGTQTGSIATQTLAGTTTTVSAGYYEATDLASVDTDLATGNIRGGVTLFGIAGSTNVVDTTSANVVDTTSGDAVAGDILSGKKAYVDGNEVTGNIATQTLSDASTTVSAGYYNTTTLNAVDADLATGNIKSGVTIFGVAGSSMVVETGGGNAVASDILSGKIAYVGGGAVTGNIVTRTLDNGTTTVSAGYYEATDLATVDTDLAAANVISGKTIFGIAGSTSSDSSAAVPKTGMTDYYSATDGEDGDLQKGVAWPSPRFTDNNNGTVTDNLTGLIWLKDSDTPGYTKNWEDALTYCNNLANGAAGLTDGSSPGDWRLPNVKELLSLIDYGNNSPALPSGQPFSGNQTINFWSSTTLPNHPSYNNSAYAWCVVMSTGQVLYKGKTLNYNYWPVRAGQ